MTKPKQPTRRSIEQPTIFRTSGEKKLYSREEVAVLQEFNYPSIYEPKEEYEQAVRELYAPAIDGLIRRRQEEELARIKENKELFRTFLTQPGIPYVQVLLSEAEYSTYQTYDTRLEKLRELTQAQYPLVKSIIKVFEAADSRMIERYPNAYAKLKAANRNSAANVLLDISKEMTPTEILTPKVQKTMFRLGMQLFSKIQNRIPPNEVKLYEVLRKSDWQTNNSIQPHSFEPTHLLDEYTALLELLIETKQVYSKEKQSIQKTAAGRVTSFNRMCKRYNIPLRAKRTEGTVYILDSENEKPISLDKYNEHFGQYESDISDLIDIPDYLSLAQYFAQHRIYRNHEIELSNGTKIKVTSKNGTFRKALAKLYKIGIAVRQKKDINNQVYWTIDIPTIAEKKYGFVDLWKQTFYILLEAPNQRMSTTVLNFILTRSQKDRDKDRSYALIRNLRDTRVPLPDDPRRKKEIKRKLTSGDTEYVLYGTRINGEVYYGLMPIPKDGKTNIPRIEGAHLRNFAPLVSYLLTQPGGATFDEILDTLYFWENAENLRNSSEDLAHLDERPYHTRQKSRRQSLNRMLRKLGIHVIKISGAKIARTPDGTFIPSLSKNILMYLPSSMHTQEEETNLATTYPLAIEEKPGENYIEHFERLLQLPWNEFLIRIVYNYADIINYMLKNKIVDMDTLRNWTAPATYTIQIPIISKYIEHKQKAVWEIIMRLNGQANEEDLENITQPAKPVSPGAEAGQARLAQIDSAVIPQSVNFIHTRPPVSSIPLFDNKTQSVLQVLKDILFDEQGVIKIDPRVIIELMKYNLNDLRIQMKNSSQNGSKNPPNSPKIELSTKQRVIASIYGVPLDN